MDHVKRLRETRGVPDDPNLNLHKSFKYIYSGPV